MEKIKQHYEKVVIGLAMLALVYVAYGIVMDNSEENIAEQKQKRNRPDLEQKKEMPPMDMAAYMATLNRLENARPLNLGNPHNLFNPVQWRVTRQGTVLKVERGNEIGAGAIILSETKPLHLKVEYRGITGTAPNIRYRFGVTREAAAKKKERLRMTTTVRGENLKDSRDLFTLLKIEGVPTDPTAFQLRLADNAGDITVRQGEVFQRVDGYTASLAYPPDKKNYPNKRVGDKLFFADDGHNIVAIEESEVVLSTASTSKRTTIRLR
ncbi:MAG TPA: hypothetical protein QGH16_02900 [Verrucomicrobiota bacterium]|nr:hypothetical protein [Verrucomicrobiota bacterium]